MERYFCVFLCAWFCRLYAFHISNNNDMDLLFHFIEHKNIKKVKAITTEKNLNPDYFSPIRQITPLAYAAQIGKISVFKYLLKHSTIIQKTEETLDGHERKVLEIAQLPERKKVLKVLRRQIKK